MSIWKGLYRRQWSEFVKEEEKQKKQHGEKSRPNACEICCKDYSWVMAADGNAVINDNYATD